MESKNIGILEKLNALKGYVQNGTDIIVSFFEDEATNDVFIVGKDIFDKRIWSAHAKTLEEAINKAYEENKQDFDE